MATALQFRRGTTADHKNFTGLAGEVTVDTDKKAVVVHDGLTPGGFPQISDQPSTRPSIRPSLLLDFQYTKQLDPRITFSRPTTATYYDGKTVVKAEENLQVYSQNFSAWNTRYGATVLTDTTNAPDGTVTADTVTASGNTENCVFYSQFNLNTLVSGSTISCFVKAGTSSIAWIQGREGGNPYAVYDLTTQTLLGSSGGTPSLINYGNGWYRIVLANLTTSGQYFAIGGKDSYTSGAPWGSGTWTAGNYIYIWGAQLEQRSTVTAYTPTTTAPITNYIPALQTAVSNDARFDHDPVTGESKGLLIEEQRTNLLTYSSEFDNAAWTKKDSTISSNTGISPDGSLSVDKLIPNTGAQSLSGVIRGFGSIGNNAYTFTCYAKAGGFSWIALESGNRDLTWFNLSTGTVGTKSTNHTAIITSVGNGWYRCSISPSFWNGSAQAWITSADNSQAVTGDGYSGVYIWGAQLEAGSFPTSYIPTVASQVTRSADSASMTGSNFSSWYRADEGTIYSEGAQLTPSSSYFGTFCISDGSSANRLYHEYGPTSQLYVTASGTTSADIDCGNTSQGVFAKLATAYKTNDFSAVLNGGTVYTDTSGNTPIVNKVNIGGDAVGAVNYSGTIKRIAYYPKRLSNAELQGLTS